MKRLIVFSVMLLFITAAALPQGRGKGPGKGMKPGFGIERMLSKLNLTADQKDKIEKLKIDHQKTMVDLQASLKKQQIDRKDLISGGTFNKKDILNQAEEMNSIHNKIALERANFLGNVAEILTDAQKKELKNVMPSAMDKKGMKRNMRNSGKGTCGAGCNMW
ncbi:MAG: Spy/CpxP family protein refolding chaperone [Bacteroidota bacterium]|nr:Spy/CpxP family protein refolding chaperone [Bacteroidota bacterium]